jgi:hypothetical protein
MQTLKKLPQTAPNTAAAAIAQGDASSEFQAALSGMPVDAKVGRALKRILPPRALSSLSSLSSLVLASWALTPGCSRGPDPATRARSASLADALRPAFFAEALRRGGGAHYHGTARFAVGIASPDDGVTTTTDVWVDGAHNYRLAETNDREGGRDVVLVGRELFVALRYGKMIRRVAEEPEPTRLLEEALGAPWAAWEVAAPYVSVERASSPGGEKATAYRLTRATARAEDPTAGDAQKGLRAWRASAVVDQLSGRAVVDDASGALRAFDLQATFTTKRDGQELKGALEVHGALTDVGSVAGVTAPPSEDLALRQRLVPEQRDLLAGLPSTRLPPAAAPKPVARPAAPGVTPAAGSKR